MFLDATEPQALRLSSAIARQLGETNCLIRPLIDQPDGWRTVKEPRSGRRYPASLKREAAKPNIIRRKNIISKFFNSEKSAS
jgi:hypothetical protein